MNVLNGLSQECAPRHAQWLWSVTESLCHYLCILQSLTRHLRDVCWINLQSIHYMDRRKGSTWLHQNSSNYLYEGRITEREEGGFFHLLVFSSVWCAPAKPATRNSIFWFPTEATCLFHLPLLPQGCNHSTMGSRAAGMPTHAPERGNNGVSRGFPCSTTWSFLSSLSKLRTASLKHCWTPGSISPVSSSSL